MNRTHIKEQLRESIGQVLSHARDNTFATSTDFGQFECSVEAFNNFAIVKRNFKTSGESLAIPFSCSDSSVQMIFSLDGKSFFNKRSDPFALGQLSHCINFFHAYDCTNLLDTHARQQDIVFRLTKGFYADLIAQYMSAAEEGLPSLIAQDKEFNTINKHRPADATVLGLLQNIKNCPFTGEMKRIYLREHIRALLMLQLFHFSEVVDNRVQPDTKITARDREVLHGVRDYINAHFLDPASLETLSKHFGINEFKLKYGFKLLFGTSPMKLLQQKRLTFALHLLCETDKSIKEISDEVGYAHAANFTTAFTKFNGHPPQHYRKGRALGKMLFDLADTR